MLDGGWERAGVATSPAVSIVVCMGINVERTRSLLRHLSEEDPDFGARGRVIVGSSHGSLMRDRAMALMASELLRDPGVLVPGEPPQWLVDLSHAVDQAAMLLFDSRLAELTARVVDDLVAQGCTTDELLAWLGDRRRSAPSSTTADHATGPPPAW
jgi:hypothetical protein